MSRKLASWLGIAMLGGGIWLATISCSGSPSVQKHEDSAPPLPPCTAELRSWVVAGRGRHLYLDLDCPEPITELSGRVEYTESRLRRGYVPPSDPQKVNRLVRLDRASILRPPIERLAQDRLEQRFELSAKQALFLQRDRLFLVRYQLLGPNSNSAMRSVLEAAGIQLNPKMIASGGPLGSFPGIQLPAGEEVPPSRWAEFGFLEGPITIPE
ncbi:MAG: hypothetical protein AAGB34_06860 [Planctomycetota bacterium]